MSVTIKNIAEYAGVSVGTVSRALNGDPLIALKTRKKIKSLATELDYIPSNIGRGLQSQKSSLIAYLISNMKSSFYDDILQGIGKVACDNNYGLLVAITEDNYKSEIEQLKIFREKSVDGIIVSNFQPETAKYLQKIEDSGTPIVIADIESFDNNVPYVRVDDMKASEMIMEHLTSLGHKKISFCFPINKNSIARYNTCAMWALKNNLPEPRLCENKNELKKLLKTNKKPTAIMCYSDQMAVDIIQTVRSIGLNVPDDISVTGFDNIEVASWPEYDITTIDQPKKGLGSTSVELLLKRIEGEKVEPVVFEPELIVRSSTGKVKR